MPEATRTDHIEAMRDKLSELEAIAQKVGDSGVLNLLSHLRNRVGNLLTFTPVKEVQEEETRDGRLMIWAAEQRINGATPFIVQGHIIKKYLGWAFSIGEGIDESNALQKAVRNDSCYKIVKACATHFDPKKYGDSFTDYAEPYLQSAIAQSIDAGRNIVPDEAPESFLTSLLDVSEQQVELDSAIEAKQTAVAPPEPTAEKAAPAPTQTETRSTKAPPPKSSKTSALPPPPAPVEEKLAPSTPEDRFIAWAQNELGEPHNADHKALVNGIADKYKKLIEGAAQKLKKQIGTYKGGIGKLKKQAMVFAKELLEQYDPESDHINQYLGNALETRLRREIVSGST